MTSALLVALTVTVTPGMVQFVARVQDYVETHRRLAAGIEQPLCSAPEEIANQANALAAAIREARPRAREGDVFTLAAADVFRARIAAMVARHGINLAAAPRNDDEGAEFEPSVLAAPPWRNDMATWAPIVRELPELPTELEYRFVGRHLVLVDTDAAIVVDILRDALPREANAPPPVSGPTFCHAHPELDACWM
jgi:hypothetical protein